MRRLSPEEAREWRRASAEKYRARVKEQWSTRRAEKAGKAPTPQSMRKATADAEYAVTRAQRMVQARMRCEYRVNPDMITSRCARVATETHHVMRRSHQVDHSVENLRALCHTHHQYIHAHVEWAKANGYIKTAWHQIEGA